MIHAHDIQNALLSGPHATPSEDGETLAFVPVYVEIMLPTGPKLVPITAAGAGRCTAHDFEGFTMSKNITTASREWASRPGGLPSCWVRGRADRPA